jgi:hypothetical protein
MKVLLAKMLSRLLTDDKKQRHADMRSDLCNQQTDSFLSKTVTGDET